MTATATIPAHYFANGQPDVTDYLGAEGNGLAYVLDSERASERNNALGTTGSYSTISLLSPYVWGFGGLAAAFGVDELYPSDCRIVAVDLESRTVTAERI
jgi:hypothetical protein